MIGIIDGLLVSNQRAGEAAQVQQMVPVRTVARSLRNTSDDIGYSDPWKKPNILIMFAVCKTQTVRQVEGRAS